MDLILARTAVVLSLELRFAERNNTHSTSTSRLSLPKGKDDSRGLCCSASIGLPARDGLRRRGRVGRSRLARSGLPWWATQDRQGAWLCYAAPRSCCADDLYRATSCAKVELVLSIGHRQVAPAIGVRLLEKVVSMAVTASRRDLLHFGFGTAATLGVSAAAGELAAVRALAQPAPPLNNISKEDLFYREDWFGEPWRKPETAVLIHGNDESSVVWFG